jgi:GntR family transcriptional regulator of vanillate catabolism
MRSPQMVRPSGLSSISSRRAGHVPGVLGKHARNNHLPFASADSIIIDPNALDREYEKLRFAQLQHQLVFEALARRESARVEMLMREHAYIGLRYGKLFGLKVGSLP